MNVDDDTNVAWWEIVSSGFLYATEYDVIAEVTGRSDQQSNIHTCTAYDKTADRST